PHYTAFFAFIIISTAVLLTVFIRKKDKKLVVLLFFIIGMAYVLEYVVFVLFESYDYDPDFMTKSVCFSNHGYGGSCLSIKIPLYFIHFSYIYGD
ncbi:hypothetical protein V7044_03125, partial [Priestia megaterium]